jgi:hypothetical protein
MVLAVVMPAGRVVFPEGCKRRERPPLPRLLRRYRRGAAHAVGMVRVIRQNQQQFVLYQLRHGQFLPGRADQRLIAGRQLRERPLMGQHAKLNRGLEVQHEWLEAALAAHGHHARGAAGQYQSSTRKHLSGKRYFNFAGGAFEPFAEPLHVRQRQGARDVSTGPGPVVGVDRVWYSPRHKGAECSRGLIRLSKIWPPAGMVTLATMHR